MSDSYSSFGGLAKKRSRLALPDGFRIGRYCIGDQLGAGGFGITYRAKDTHLNRLVAIKELLPTSIATRSNSVEVAAHTESEEDDWEWAQNRFIQEAETVAACQHPNVLQVYEVFRANGTVYMVTKFEEGCNLAEWYGRLGHAPNERELRSILEPLLSALDRVHSQGFLHRDIKPENIYLADDGRPVLIDFGSARQKITHKSLPLTKIVTPAYAPFEQYLDDGHQGPFTDLYSMGAVLYRGITGNKPPEAPQRSAPSIPDPCIRLSKTYAHAYDRVFLECIDAALAPEARDRPQSAMEWLRHMGGGLKQRTPSDSASPDASSGIPGRTQARRSVFGQSRSKSRSSNWNPSVFVTLNASHHASKLPPIQLIGTNCFRIGREQEGVHFLSWFWPRDLQNDARTLRLGRVHVEIMHNQGHLLLTAQGSVNGTAFVNRPFGNEASVELRQSETLVLAEDYRLEVTPFPSQSANNGSPSFGAVRFTPLNSDFAYVRPVWVLSEATFGSRDSNPIVLKEPGIADVHGRVRYHNGQFWLEPFARHTEIEVDGKVLGANDSVSLADAHILRLGTCVFDLR